MDVRRLGPRRGACGRDLHLIETAKLNDVDPQAWLADVLARIADHPAKRITDLLPWNWDAATRRRQAALGGITAENQRS